MKQIMHHGWFGNMNIKEFYCGKRVLVTGHTGFKGGWLSTMLLNMGANVCGVSLEPVDDGIFSKLELSKKLNSNIVDIRDYNKLFEIFNRFEPEIVFHLAAQPLVIDSYENPKYTYEVNVMGTVNICECIRNVKSVKSFINVTTDKVYQNFEKDDYYFNEDDKLNGFDPYSNSKSCSELVTSSYINSFFRSRNIAVSTCRAGNVIGGGDSSCNRIIPDCIKYTLMNENIEVRNPNSIRPYQHVLEANYFYLLLAMKQYDNNFYSGSYNIGPNKNNCINTEELVKKFCELWGKDANYVITNKFGPHEANYLKLDISKASKVLGWKPKLSIDDALKLTIEWEKKSFLGENMFDVTLKQIENYVDGENYGNE